MLQSGGQAGDAGPTRAAWRATGAFVSIAAGYTIALELWKLGVALPASAWFGAGVVALILAVAGGARCGRVGLVLCALLLGAGHFTARILESPRDGVASVLRLDGAGAAGRIAEIEGVVLSDPEETTPSGALASFMPLGGGRSFEIGARRVHGDSGAADASGRVRVFARGDVSHVRAGDRVRVTGLARAVSAPLNPGEPDARLWARQDRREATMVVQDPTLVRHADGARSFADRAHGVWLRTRATLRARALAAIGGGRDPRASAVLGALLLGENDGATRETRAVFARQGLAHVLAISGFHLAVMAGAALFAVRLTGDRGRLEPLAVCILVLLYVLLLPAKAPILRAATLVVVWLGTEAIGRRYDMRALLAWVAAAVMLLRPMDLFGLGYQLTFGITAALVWLGGRAHERLFPSRLTFRRMEPPDALEGRWWLDRLARLCSASVLCWLVATPLVARTIGVVSPGAVVATVVVVPLITVVLWLGYVTLVVGMATPAAAPVPAAAMGVVASAVVAIVGFADRLPLTTLYAPRLSLALTAALTALGAWWLVSADARRRRTWLVTLAVGAWLSAEAVMARGLTRSTVLRIDTIAVGDGTCHLIRSGRGAMLWDCGSLSPGVGVLTIPRACRTLGAARVPEVVITHANFDHYSGLLDCVEPLGVRTVTVGTSFMDAARRDPRGAAATVLERLRVRSVEIRVIGGGDRLRVGDATLDVLSPNAGGRFERENDNSLVAMVRAASDAGERRVLLCGDIQREAMAALLGPETDLRAEVLELPHHGSVHDTAFEFLERVDPTVVLQSTGPSRAGDIRWNAQRAGRTWLTTATDGACSVRIERSGDVAAGSFRRR